MQIDVTQDFKYAYGGNRVVEYTAGETVDVLDECGELAVKEGWAKRTSAKRPPAKGSPEKAASQEAPETK